MQYLNGVFLVFRVGVFYFLRKHERNISLFNRRQELFIYCSQRFFIKMDLAGNA